MLKGIFHKILVLLIATGLSAVSLFAFAGSNNGLVYHGRILKPDGTPLEDSAVTYTLKIYGRSGKYFDGAGLQLGAERCLLYQETHVKNMSTSMGAFELIVGEGT